METQDLQKDGQPEVVVVDDSLESLQLLTDILTHQGYKVRPTTNGRFALLSIEKKRPDLIVLDVNMPDMNGYEVCSRLKSNKHTKHIPVLFISAHNETQEKVKGFELGAVDFITKPFEPEEVSVRVKTHLHLRDLNEKLEHQVYLRTKELEEINNKLQLEIEERKQTEKELLCNRKELKNQIEEFQNLNEVHLVQNKELKKTLEELRKTNKQLVGARSKAEESDKLKSAFLANMSHEVRTPMNGILGFASLLKDSALSKKEQIEYIEIIQKNSKRLLNVIEDLIDISKIESDQIDIKLLPTSLNKVFSDLYLIYKQPIECKGLEIRNNTSSKIKDCVIYTDQAKLTQVLSNLLSNAVKYTKCGYIEFGYSFERNDVLFYVRDSGIGIPQGLEKTIFERFRQADLSPFSEAEGSGLGLSISKAFVEKMGGKIGVKSQVGQGSEFYFTLPFIEEAKDIVENEMKIRAGGEADFSGITVLVAEDDEASYALLRKILSQMNIKTLHAINGEEAIELCGQEPEPQLVLMDLKMKGMDGLTATRQIKRTKPDLPVIVQTAYTLTVDRNAALSSGCDDYLEKPIKKEELISCIEKYVVR